MQHVVCAAGSAGNAERARSLACGVFNGGAGAGAVDDRGVGRAVHGDGDVLAGCAVFAGDGEFVGDLLALCQGLRGWLAVVQGVDPGAGGCVEREAAVGACQRGAGGRLQQGFAGVHVQHRERARGGVLRGRVFGDTACALACDDCNVVGTGDGDNDFTQRVAVFAGDDQFVRHLLAHREGLRVALGVVQGVRPGTGGGVEREVAVSARQAGGRLQHIVCAVG